MLKVALVIFLVVLGAVFTMPFLCILAAHLWGLENANFWKWVSDCMFLKTIPLSSLRKQQNRKIVKIVSSCACVVIACMNTGNVELTLEIVIFVHCLHYFTLEVMTNKIYVCVNILYIFIYIHTHTYKHILYTFCLK